jgi:hypothetical protein
VPPIISRVPVQSERQFLVLDFTAYFVLVFGAVFAVVVGFIVAKRVLDTMPTGSSLRPKRRRQQLVGRRAASRNGAEDVDAV